jgi:peroxin-5
MQSDWADSFQANNAGKGKARETPPPIPAAQAMILSQPFIPSYPYQPSLQPMHAEYRLNLRTEAQQKEMEEAFERALEDAKAQSKSTTTPPQEETEEVRSEEEMREAKGEFDKVWESLRPEAERLGQLAEWERDFSRVRFLTLQLPVMPTPRSLRVEKMTCLTSYTTV